jgi:hypothetical protein
MMLKSRSRLAIVALIGAMLACNLPGTTPTLSVDEQAATAIAATLLAQDQQGGDVPITATASKTARPSTIPATTNAAARTITPTFSTPQLTVLESTNCREGPGQDYEVVFTYLPNKTLTILGRYDPTNYWLVKADETSSGQCWLWGEYVEVSGSYWVVPSVTPPATATLAPPQAPSIQRWEYGCSAGQMTITIEWTDRATNETGYRILRDGESVAELAANSTNYSETIPMESGESASYFLQVYGPGGTTNASVGQLTC